MSFFRFRLVCFALFLAIGFKGTAQNIEKTLSIFKTDEKITVDGELNESVWIKCEAAKDFWQNFPADTMAAKSKTEAFVTYDDKYLYIAAICYDTIQKPFVIQSLKRDFSAPVSDCFVVSIDPFSDKTNGFSFGLNPYGVQREGLIAGGGGGGVSTDWDNRWFSEVKRYADKWTLEMAIPFKTLRFKTGLKEWRINFARNDLKRNENSAWSKVPRQFNTATLAFTGKMLWDNAPEKSGPNVSLIPYLIGKVNQDFSNKKKPVWEGNGGLDAKFALTSSLNLDLSINPDFSQVDVDRQITNLTRFSLFFPERRNFFIENSDLFSNFGFRQIRPFFSRRIGLNNGTVVPIYGGLRLSGKINKNWRIGIMDMQTKKVTDINLLPQNYFVAAAQRQVFDRSNLAFIFVNSEVIDSGKILPNKYNRVLGADFNLASKNNKWYGKFFYHHSFSAGRDNHASDAHASYLVYNSQAWALEWNHEYVHKDYNAETGFVPRTQQIDVTSGTTHYFTYWRLEPRMHRYFYPKNSKINKHGPGLYIDHYRNSDLLPTDLLLKPSYNIYFTNTCSLQVEYDYIFTKLLFATDITFSGDTTIAAGKYSYQNMNVIFKTDARKKLHANFTANYGSYFNGNKFSLTSEIVFRKQPWGIFTFAYTRDEIWIPDPKQYKVLNLFGPKIELSFSRSLFFTTFLQYNAQVNNFNINSRIQWRFKPMSDLYIVYSDNYIANNFTKKNRALVIKLVYWFSA
ncbi:MAG: carbohydrate binding family 9 domain-containing protein [Bacteroidia bacterium]|nr:carbohydrate binding family 9 domain-containing protein [Bacteroidia bacterium]